MTNPFIYIRYKQISRILSQLGLGRFFFLLGLVIVALVLTFAYTTSSSNAQFNVALYLLLLFTIHQKRPDKHFVQFHFGNSKLIFFQEYFILLLPLMVGLIYHAHFLILAILLSLTFLISTLNINFKIPVFNTWFQQLIPDECFEYKSGFRKNMPLLISIWLIGLGTSFLIGSAPIAMLLLLYFTIGFYDFSEPVNMIFLFEMKPSKFIWRKTLMALLMYSVLQLPLVIAFVIFQPSIWYIALILFTLGIMVTIFAVLTKYAFYEPNSRPGAASIFHSIGAISVFIPVFLPLVWILSVKFYFNAIQKLNPYLHDFD